MIGLFALLFVSAAYAQNCTQFAAQAACANFNAAKARASKNIEAYQKAYEAWADYATTSTVEKMAVDSEAVRSCAASSSDKQIRDLVEFNRQIVLLMQARGKNYVNKVGLSGTLFQEAGTSDPSGEQVWNFMVRHGISDDFLAADRANIANLKSDIEAEAVKHKKKSTADNGNKQPREQAASEAKILRSINFREFSYRVGPPYCDDFGPTINVHQGKFANRQATFEVSRVLYGDLTGAGQEEAVVVSSCTPQVVAHPGFENNLVYVYGIENGQAALLSTFAYGQPWNFKGWATEPKRRDQLTLFDVTGVSIGAGSISFEHMAGEARCCPTFYVTQTFHWTNGQFVLAGEQQRPWTDNTGMSPEAQESVRRAVAVWVESFRTKDAARNASCYAPLVETYFRLHNVSREQLQHDKEAAFAKMLNIRKYDVSDVHIEAIPSVRRAANAVEYSRATAVFQKEWDATESTGKDFSGKEIGKLTFASSPDGWKIVREEEVRILEVSRR